LIYAQQALTSEVIVQMYLGVLFRDKIAEFSDSTLRPYASPSKLARSTIGESAADRPKKSASLARRVPSNVAKETRGFDRHDDS
jgi:hypothetical protein